MPDPLPGPATPKRILVIDDEPLVSDALARLLRHDGHTVSVALSASGALASFQKNLFDLLIVDYSMPDMNGDEFAARIHALDPHQPLLIITAHLEQLITAGGQLQGVDLIISKPFGLDELRRAVSRLTAA